MADATTDEAPPSVEQIVADYLRTKLPDLAIHLAPEPDPEDYRTLIRIGGVATGAVVAIEILDSGRIVYEVEPFPAWAGFKPHPRRAIEP